MGLAACSDNTVVKEPVERVPGTAVEYTGSDYVTVSEGDNWDLKLNPSTGTFRMENRETGQYLDSNMANVDGISDTTAISDYVFNYYSGSDSDKYAAYTAMDSYNYAILTDALTYEDIDNGVRMIYSLGSDAVTYKDFPTLIAEERMNELVLQYLDESQLKVLDNAYHLSKSGVYSRQYGETKQLKGLGATELYNLFYEVGHYTYDELEYDAQENGTEEDLPNRQNVQFSVDVYLDGDDLVVELPGDEMSYELDNPLKDIVFLPYFMSSNSTDGYLLVPDGSGALIYLDNNYTGYQYTARYYNGDILTNASTYNSFNNEMTLPIYGMKSDDMAILGIIEEGAEVATLTTAVNGTSSAVPYARAYLTFTIRDVETTGNFVGATTKFTQRMTSEDYFADTIRVRYRFLTGDDANYTGMAKAYQDYLKDQGVLTEAETEDEAPIFVNFLGEVDKTKYFLGVPYDGKVSLTTFSQAKDILASLTTNGVQNIKVQYTGLANNGLNQRAVESVKISNELGGTSGLQELASYVNSIGGELYPDFQLQTAYTSKGLSKAERSFFIIGSVAQIYNFDLVTNIVKTNEKYPLYIISPTYISDYISKFESSYSKLGINGLSSSDFMTFISANYKKGENLSMTNAKPAYEKAMNTLADYELILSNPIVDAYNIADYITDLPRGNSGLRVLDASIPFTQLVLNGCITYATEALNTTTSDIWEDLMRAIETKSALKFRFIAADTTVLQDTMADDIFMSEYSLWEDKIGAYYEEYNEYYQKVKDATIVSHEVFDRNDKHVKVVYSNGVTVYLNYDEEEAVLDGVSVSAQSYVVK